MTKTSLLVILLLSSPVCSATPEIHLDTVTVAYQSVAKELVINGTVEAVNQATLAAQTSGQVLEVNFDVDDFVKADQVLARLKSIQQTASLGQSKAQLAEVEARLKVAQKEYARIKQLYKKQAVSAAQMDKAQAELEVAQAQVVSVRAASNQATEQVEYTVIRAPDYHLRTDSQSYQRIKLLYYHCI